MTVDLNDEDTTSPTGDEDEPEGDDASLEEDVPPDYLDPKPMDPTGR